MVRYVIPAIALAAVLGGCDRGFEAPATDQATEGAAVVDDRQAPIPDSSFVIPQPGGARAVYDITLHDADQLRVLLRRLEQLAERPNTRDVLPEIALVLHGQEVEFFALDNYEKYRDLVDLAAKLDAFQIIEVKMCQTRMRNLGLDSSDIPAFIELVPYGPDEVDRLVKEGYLTM
jgi:intracellular sulfur oxidation DsrE/DsrF family protein